MQSENSFSLVLAELCQQCVFVTQAAVISLAPRKLNETSPTTGNQRHQGHIYLKAGVHISSPDEKQVHMVQTHWKRIQGSRNLIVWDTPLFSTITSADRRRAEVKTVNTVHEG